MKILLLVFFTLFSFQALARFTFSYGVNYSNQTDSSKVEENKHNRLFHKAFIGASFNRSDIFFLGWNINSWNSTTSYGSNNETTYQILEMGPKIQLYFSDSFNWYMSAEWNPYAKGSRNKANVAKDVSGSSFGVGLGYRYKISALWGLGASLQYHALALKEETRSSTTTSISDNVSNIMPMLELTVITK